MHALTSHQVTQKGRESSSDTLWKAQRPLDLRADVRMPVEAAESFVESEDEFLEEEQGQLMATPIEDEM